MTTLMDLVIDAVVPIPTTLPEFNVITNAMDLSMHFRCYKTPAPMGLLRTDITA